MPNSMLKNPKRINDVKLGQPEQPTGRMLALTRLYERLQTARQEVHDIEVEIERITKTDKKGA